MGNSNRGPFVSFFVNALEGSKKESKEKQKKSSYPTHW